MARIPKWFKSYLEQNEINFNLLVLVALFTAITSFGLPQPPKIILDFLSQYKWVRWILLWLLIFQGGAGQNILITNVAFSVVFIFYNLDWEYIIDYIKKNKTYLVILLPMHHKQ